MDGLTNNTDAIVLAQKVQQTQAARSIYLKNLRAPKDIRKAYLDELSKNEKELETYAYAVLHPLPTKQRTYANKRY